MNSPAPVNQPLSQNIPSNNNGKQSFAKYILIGLFILMLGIIILLGYQLVKTNSDNKKQAKVIAEQLSVQTEELKTSKALLDAASVKLANAQFVPDFSKFSPQCDSPHPGNDMYVSTVNKKPIGGYQLFLVNCKSDLAKGDANSKLVGFKVEGNGELSFAYGASSFEPVCIHSGILPNSQQLSQETGLAICKKT